MNGVDEVAVKLVKADRPTQKEMSLFQKEVNSWSHALSLTVEM